MYFLYIITGLAVFVSFIFGDKVHRNQTACIFATRSGDCNAIGEISNKARLRNNGGEIVNLAGAVKG